MQRIDVGDSETVGDQASRSRASSRPDAHAHLARRRGKILCDEEVAGEAHRPDDAKLHVQPLADVLGHDAPEAPSGALEGQMPEKGVRAVVLVGDREVGHEEFAHRDLQAALLGDLRRRRQRAVDDALVLNRALADARQERGAHLGGGL